MKNFLFFYIFTTLIALIFLTGSFTLSESFAQERMQFATQTARLQKSNTYTVFNTKDLPTLFMQRPAKTLTPWNIVAYEVQHSIRLGVPVNTIMLLLLMPVLATIIAFFRHVIGIPTLGTIVPVALSITLLETGITVGVILFALIIVSSLLARLLFKKIRIMQLSKVTLSLFVVCIFIFILLTFGAQEKLLDASQSAIFPVLLLILLSERIVSLQLERNARETIQITLLTLSLGILGYFLLLSTLARNIVLLYPETVFLVIPVNILIGRYFGLRVSEYFRFSSVIRHGSK